MSSSINSIYQKETPFKRFLKNRFQSGESFVGIKEGIHIHFVKMNDINFKSINSGFVQKIYWCGDGYEIDPRKFIRINDKHDLSGESKDYLFKEIRIERIDTFNPKYSSNCCTDNKVHIKNDFEDSDSDEEDDDTKAR